MVPNLLNIPDTPRQLNTFSWNNQTHHIDVYNAIFRQTTPTSGFGQGHITTLYTLDPIPTFDIKSWLWRHQDMHNSVNAALGINGFDLTDMDFQNRQSLQAWIFNHYAEHYQWANKLGVF